MSNDAPTRGETFVKMAIATVPYVGGPLGVLYEDILARRKARVSAMGIAALSRFEGTSEHFVMRLGEEPRLGGLFVTAAEAAARTTVDEKARAMGLLLADAADARGNESSFDEKELLLLALADLEWPHIRALGELGSFPTDEELHQQGKSNQTLGASPKREDRLRAIEALPSPVLAALLRHGLVQQESAVDGLYVNGLTPFGHKLLAYLQGAVQVEPN